MRIIFFLFSIALFGACKNQETAKNGSAVNDEDHKALRYLKEVEWPKAYREQDTALLDKILGDDFKMIDGDGNWSDKKSEIDWIKNNPWITDSFHFEIKRLEILENGTAIVSGTGHITGDSTEATYQSSNILIKRNGLWKAVSSHVSGFKQQAK